MSNNLNINTANFGNNDNYMFLYDPAMYVDFHDGNGLMALGYMEAQKTFRQVMNYAVFKTGIPKTEIRRDIIEQSFEVEAILKQLQPETLALVAQRRFDSSDATWDRVMLGSQVPSPVFPSCVLIGQTVDGNELRLYIRRLQITAESIEMMLGGDNYASVPFKGTAQKDSAPLTTNPDWPYNPSYANQDNIAFWAWPKASTSS